MKVIYISGPITATTEAQYENNVMLARTMAAVIWGMGAGVHCPHMNTDFGFDKLKGMDYEQFMEFDLQTIEHCDALYMLPDWESSPGAVKEHEYARFMGVRILYDLTEVADFLEE